MSEQQAKYSAAGNRILPNTFQHPNVFIDRLMYYLTPEENTVLTFATRRILGFQDNISLRKDNISLSQFTDGQKSERDGHPLCLGCGMGAGTIKRALDALERYKILIPTTAKPDPRKGQEYWLQDNELAIDWDGLEQRVAEKRDKAIRQTKGARAINPNNKGTVGQHSKKVYSRTVGKGTVGQQSRVQSDSTTKPIETHLNPPIYIDPIAQKLTDYKFKLNANAPVIIQGWKDDFKDEIILRAIEDAHGRGKNSMAYVEAIIIGWKAGGVPPTREERINNARTNHTGNKPTTYQAPEYTAEEIAEIQRFKAAQYASV